MTERHTGARWWTDHRENVVLATSLVALAVAGVSLFYQCKEDERSSKVQADSETLVLDLTSSRKLSDGFVARNPGFSLKLVTITLPRSFHTAWPVDSTLFWLPESKMAFHLEEERINQAVCDLFNTPSSVAAAERVRAFKAAYKHPDSLAVSIPVKVECNYKSYSADLTDTSFYWLSFIVDFHPRTDSWTSRVYSLTKASYFARHEMNDDELDRLWQQGLERHYADLRR